MQLIDEIVELLSAKNPSLENALFKAQVLAHRLGEGELRQWIDSEIKGYTDTTALPSYRVTSVTVMGNFSNAAYRYSDQPLPLAHLDKRLRTKLETKHLTQSIAVIEKWSKNEADLSVVIAPEFYPALSKGLGGGYSVERAWGKHSVGAMLQVVVEVRSRLLDFALKIGDKLPREISATEIKKVSKEIAVADIFRNSVFGDNTTIVVGSGTIHGVSNSVSYNDFESLAAELRKHSVSDTDVDSLREAINADQGAEEHKAKKPGPRVRKWIGDMVAKAGSSAWQVTLGAAGNILASLISAYYGFGIQLQV